MFNFVPNFGARVENEGEWCWVPLSLLPAGYKLRRQIVGGRKRYRLSGPGGMTIPVRGPEHARIVVDDAIRASTVERYTNALLGITRDEDGDTLVFVIGDVGEETQYGSIQVLADLLEEAWDNLEDYADHIDKLAGDGKGLIFDFNSIDPWSFFQDNGDVYPDRFQTIEEVTGFVDTMTI